MFNSIREKDVRGLRGGGSDRFRRKGAVLCLAVALGGSVTGCGGSDIRTIAITGLDYAYQDVPTEVEEGLATFTFKNVGKEEHEYALVEINPGQTLASALAEPGEARKRVTSRGQVYAPPGENGRPLRVHLNKGNYALICFIPSPQDNVFHYLKGMQATFRVE